VAGTYALVNAIMVYAGLEVCLQLLLTSVRGGGSRQLQASTVLLWEKRPCYLLNKRLEASELVWTLGRCQELNHDSLVVQQVAYHCID
jgi:hypothetical protein